MLRKYSFYLFFSVLIVVGLISCADTNHDRAFNDITAICGNWSSYQGVKFNENWKIDNQNKLIGIGFSLNNDDTAFVERLIIDKKFDTLYYMVFLKDGEKSVDFKLKEASSYSWLFENEDNDYPSRILYELDNDTLLTVTISDINDNRQQMFYLKKVISNF